MYSQSEADLVRENRMLSEQLDLAHRAQSGLSLDVRSLSEQLADAQATVEALQRDRIFKEYVRLFRLCEPIAKMLSELSILPISCSREQELAWKMAVKNFRHYQRDYAADVLLQAALTPAGETPAQLNERLKQMERDQKPKGTY